MWRRYVGPKMLVRFTSTSVNFKPKIIETLPTALHTHLFGTKPPATANPHDLNLELPRLKGADVIEHFRIIAHEQAEPYVSLLKEAAEKFTFTYKENSRIDDWTSAVVSSTSGINFRPLSEIQWEYKTGWIRYSHEDGSFKPVPFPEEDVLFFDVEVLVSEGGLPTLAVALSDKAWYGWCSERLINDAKVPEYTKLEHLISIGDVNSKRIIIGHNVGFDRARVRECYSLNKHQIRFMDTMSMNLSMFGMADHQAEPYKMDEVELEEATKRKQRKDKSGWMEAWKSRVSKNGLKDVLAKQFNISMTKEARDYFKSGSIEEIRENFQELMRYCATDNLATAMIYSKLWPEFRKRFPEDITILGMLGMANAYLPINQNWIKFYDNTNRDSANAIQDAAWGFLEAARPLYNEGLENPAAISNDLWLFNEQGEQWWNKLFKKKKTAQYVLKEGNEWASAEDVVTKSSFVPLVFGLIYNCYPLYKSEKLGWGYLAPKNGKKSAKTRMAEDVGINTEMLKKKINEFKDDFGDAPLPEEVDIRYMDCDFYKIPHPLSESDNVGSILAKNFYSKIETKTIRATRFEPQFKKLVNSIKITQHWTNYKKRFDQEIAVYYNETNTAGAISPSIVPAGTVTRRSTHKLWVTLSNDSATGETLGKGIKNMVQAPNGMKIVGADVDSQEQWLAAIFGDSSVAKILPEEKRYSGITPFSNMMLAGNKSDGSDLHSVVARELKINRNDAKVLNYARLYGAGQGHAEKSLLKSLNPIDAKEVAANLFALTKGVQLKCRKLSAVGTEIFKQYEAEHGEQNKVILQGIVFVPDYSTSYSKSITKFEDWAIQKIGCNPEFILPIIYDNLAETVELYFNGYETATFNFLEQESKKSILRTPVLNCQLTDALSALPEGTPDIDEYSKKFKRSVMNWIVQSSAVDFLHLLLVAMDWLCKEYNINARFVVSIHDEVRYLCPEDETHRVGLALMISHLFVRAFISQRLGFHQLPMSVAFFSQVDCDTILRKEVNTPCINPDNSAIENGVTWNINELIKVTDGSLGTNLKKEQVSM